MYAVKANRYLTQAKKLKDCAEPVARMMAPAARHSILHLGCVLPFCARGPVGPASEG